MMRKGSTISQFSRNPNSTLSWFRLRCQSLPSCAIAIGSNSATSTDPDWASKFQSKSNTIPTATSDCSVCFYEQAGFKGLKFCVGKADNNCTEVNPINTPTFLRSIKFPKGCELAAYARMQSAAYPTIEHVRLISTDVANTSVYTAEDYDLSDQILLDIYPQTSELYVEEAGRACFLGGNVSDAYGHCYTEEVTSMDHVSFDEVMLFKTKKHDFDVVVYDNDQFNGCLTVRWQ